VPGAEVHIQIVNKLHVTFRCMYQQCDFTRLTQAEDLSVCYFHRFVVGDIFAWWHNCFNIELFMTVLVALVDKAVITKTN
jgi:hypothetical protein